MRRIILSLILMFIFGGCAHAASSLAEKEIIYAPIEASLTHINQKIASHLFIIGIPDGFNANQYKKIVEEVCYPTPSCKSQAEAIFSSYEIQARKVDEMFSVMLCDKDIKMKFMEDFSCNNMLVEVQSWKENNVACDYEKDWIKIKLANCKE